MPSSKYLFFIGIFFVLLWTGFTLHQATRLSFAFSSDLVKTVKSQNYPIQINFPTIDKTLPVERTFIIKGVWGISPDAVSYLATSGGPDTEENIIIYGHNTEDRLKKLHDLQNGDYIEVKDQNNRIYAYQVTEKIITEPTDITTLTRHDGETLTIYTCTGFADLKRLVVKAKRSA